MSHARPFRRATFVSRFVPAAERVFLRPTCVNPRPGIVAKPIIVRLERKHRSLTSDSGKPRTDVSWLQSNVPHDQLSLDPGQFVELAEARKKKNEKEREYAWQE